MLFMTASSLNIHALRESLASVSIRPSDLARQALKRSNQNAGKNTHLWQDSAWTLAEAMHAESMPCGIRGQFGDGRSPLWGLPISMKDCFDLAGSPTSCGVRFYRDLNGTSVRDSWLVEQLRAAGAVITGKTHLHPLAYGITGENPDFGDCEQPGNPGTLTGGSSSGAAASVLEGSAVAAIGTDTGGSIRVPAALCGLVGYRASIGRGNWRGGAHLAESFDTMGWLFRDLRDAPLFASVFAPKQVRARQPFRRFAIVHDAFLHDCEPEIVGSMRKVAAEIEALGLKETIVDVGWWAEAFEIFAPIQASEAARVHAGHIEHFQPDIRERLQWGAQISDSDLVSLRERHAAFRARVDSSLAEHDLLMLPASPVACLAAGADHSQTRKRLLRYTTPFSLASVPVVTIPSSGGGMQLAAARECDEQLLDLAAQLGVQRKLTGSSSRE